MIPCTNMAPVENVWYGTTTVNETQTDVLWVTYTVDGETYRDFIPNGPYGANNLALQTLAYLGCSPSQMDPSDIERNIPTYIDDDVWHVHRNLLASWGSAAINEADWIVTTEE